MSFHARKNLLALGIVVAIALAILGGIICSTVAHAESAGVMTASARAVNCSGGGGGDCDECANQQ